MPCGNEHACVKIKDNKSSTLTRSATSPRTVDGRRRAASMFSSLHPYVSRTSLLLRTAGSAGTHQSQSLLKRTKRPHKKLTHTHTNTLPVVKWSLLLTQAHLCALSRPAAPTRPKKAKAAQRESCRTNQAPRRCLHALPFSPRRRTRQHAHNRDRQQNGSIFLHPRGSGVVLGFPGLSF